MISEQELPDSIIERIKMMESILIDAATYGSSDDTIYVHLRREFTNDHQIRNLLPDFVHTYRSLEAFWPFIKNEAETYAERRQIISAAFTPLVDSLEGQSLAPNQHSEEPIKAILGSVTNLVNGIGTLRNRLSDSHGKGGPLPVRPSPRHASLAVNAAGAVAAFLVETHLERRSSPSR